MQVQLNQAALLTVQSEPGQGTTFKICLPRVQARAEPLEREHHQPLRGGTETLLLVEDEAEVRRLAERTLQHHGYTVLTARDGREAMTVFRRYESEIDLIIADLVMPKMSGRTLCEALRDEGKAVKFLFISGYIDPDQEDRRRLECNFPFLQKPWSVESLLRKVREALDAAL